MILVFKLLEIFQFVLISFYVSLFITDYYNDILYDYLYKFFKKDKNKITEIFDSSSEEQLFSKLFTISI